MNIRRFLFLSVGLVLGTLASCIGTYNFPTEGHCVNEDGDATCAMLDPEMPYCDGCSNARMGCVADRPAEDSCYYACGGQSIRDDDSCVIPTDADTDDSDASCTGPADCTDPDQAFCDLVTGDCVGCDATADGDSACAGLDADAPVCAGGVCVQCAAGELGACAGTSPICDLDTSTCVGCSDHLQCQGSACDLAQGNCFELSSVVHVDGDEGCGIGDGGQASPFCSLGEALGEAPGDAVIILHERNVNPLMYAETNLISTSVAVLAAAGETPRILGSAGDALSVSGSGDLFIEGVEISGGDATGIVVNGAAWIDDSRITDHAGHGVWVSGGELTIRRSRIVNNDAGAVLVDAGGVLVLESSFAGGDQSDQRAVDIVDGAASIVYSTLAGGFGVASALWCDDGSNTTVRNSLLVARTADDELNCAGASVTANALEMVVAGNTSVGTMTDTGWFESYAQGDYGLSNMHPIQIDTAATWLTGDPTFDIDGDPRPATNGSLDLAGADVVP